MNYIVRQFKFTKDRYRSILALLAGSKNDNLAVKISSIEVGPTDPFWHVGDGQFCLIFQSIIEANNKIVTDSCEQTIAIRAL
jgi:hypothetical protein